MMLTGTLSSGAFLSVAAALAGSPRSSSPPVVRLQGRTAFQRLFEKGRRTHHPLLFVVWHRDDASGFGCNVLSAVKGSVVRNRIKRRLREAFRLHAGRVVKHVRVMVMAKPPAARATFQELELALVASLKRAGLMDSTQEGAPRE